MLISALVFLLAFSISVHYFQRKWEKKVNQDFIETEKALKSFDSAKECLGYFKTPIPKGYVIFHKNGNKSDNRFNNLEIITRKEMLARIGKKKNA